MRLIPVSVMFVLVLVLLSVAGCTTQPAETNLTPSNATPSNGSEVTQALDGINYPWTWYNGLIIQFVDRYHDQLNATQTETYKLTDWRESRLDQTSMSVYWVFENTTGGNNQREVVTATAKLFSTDSDALAFVNAHTVGMKLDSEGQYSTIDSANSRETKMRFVTYSDNFVIYGNDTIVAY
jgi:hypothetical protein